MGGRSRKIHRYTADNKKEVLRNNLKMNRITLQTKLIGCLLLTSTILIGLSFYLLIDAWRENHRAEAIIQLGRQANSLFETFKDLTFERGRTNVVLSSGKPVSSSDREFIETRRKSVDENMIRGLVWLEKDYPPLAGKLRTDYNNLMRLRQEIDSVATVGASAERLRLSGVWYEQTTGFIHHIIEVLEIIGKKQEVPGRFDNYHRLLIDVLVFRDRIGQSGSIMTAALSKNLPLSVTEYRHFSENLAQADYVWTQIEAESVILGNEMLNSQKAVVYSAYYEKYRPVLEEAIPPALAGKASPMMIKQLKELSVPAFDSVFRLLEQYKEAVAADMNEQKSKAFISLVLALIQFTIGLMVVAATILYFRNRLFQPLDHLIRALENIQRGESVSELSMEMSRTDEIGRLAAGVKMLETSMAEERTLRKLIEYRAVRDELTGLHNRHFLEQNIESVMKRSDRYGENVSMVIFDLDYFKKVNDTWGHPAGDAVLRQTARLTEQRVRESDWLMRFGGEEFIILMPQTAIEGAVAAAEKVRASFERHDHQGVGKVTASFGVSQRKKNESFGNWYSRTDQALYKAKQAGRNCVVSATEADLPVQAEQIKWFTQWETGNSLIDEQHKKLVDLSNSLIAASMTPEAEPEKVLLCLNRLLDSLITHFESEEKILKETGYPEAEDHAALHRQLLQQTDQLKTSYLKKEIKDSVFLLFVVNDVVMEHMLKEDKLFFPYIKKHDGH